MGLESLPPKVEAPTEEVLHSGAVQQRLRASVQVHLLVALQIVPPATVQRTELGEDADPPASPGRGKDLMTRQANGRWGDGALHSEQTAAGGWRPAHPADGELYRHLAPAATPGPPELDNRPLEEGHREEAVETTFVTDSHQDGTGGSAGGGADGEEVLERHVDRGRTIEDEADEEVRPIKAVGFEENPVEEVGAFKGADHHPVSPPQNELSAGCGMGSGRATDRHPPSRAGLANRPDLPRR